MRWLLIALALVVAPGLASAVSQPVEPPPPKMDVSAVQGKLRIAHDGRGHYVAVVPWDDLWSHVYYGNGTLFHAQRVIGGSSEGTDRFERTFWEPRVKARWQAALGFRDGRYYVQCDDRTVALAELAPTETAAMVAKAEFRAHLWGRKAYALARDHAGTYYFVDVGNRPGQEQSFRLYSGPRGALRPMAMTNVVSDSAGDVFTTRAGKLRLVLAQGDSWWIAGQRETKLIWLPIEDNARMIYTDLGAYAGRRLGTPCDDL
jgi:hypothetical protein